jgi:FtsZ-binding cell division protein ZapB
MANKLDNLKKGGGFDLHPERINREGRPKKYVTLLREQGYKLSEINDTIQVMLQMGVDELKEVWDNPKATILEKTIANAMRESLEKGSLYSVETLLTRVYGKPKESQQVQTDSRIEVVFVNGKTIL